jgi:prevent-host-death family protein
MQSYNVAEAKSHLSEILAQVSEGHEVVLTRRGKPIARLVPMEPNSHILGAGTNDPNIDREVLARDQWWKPSPDPETQDWYE